MYLNEMPDLLTVKDVQNFLNVSKTTAYKIFNNNDFPTVAITSQRDKRVMKKDFLAWLEGQKKTAVSE